MSGQMINSLIETVKYSYLFNRSGQNHNNNQMQMILISILLIFISYLFNNERLLENIGEKLSTKFRFNKCNSVLLEGKRCFRMSEFNCRSDQLFSNRFKAIWYYLAKTSGNNSSVYSIKEFADSSNIYDEQGDAYNSIRSNRNSNSNSHRKQLDMYVVNQKDQFILYDEIFCKVSTKNDNAHSKSNNNSNGDNNNKLEIIKLEIFSYTKSLDDIKLFIDKISMEFISEIHNTRINKKFIYTLLGKNLNKYDDEQIMNKYNEWEECEFASSRRFDNLFFEEKENVIAKIKFFQENKDWYKREGHPWTFGLGLSGPPGTGKTSIIKCIANLLNRHLIVIPLNKIKTQKEFSQYYFETRYNLNNASDSISFDNKIIVFEDIDCMTDIVRQRKKTSSKNHKSSKKSEKNESESEKNESESEKNESEKNEKDKTNKILEKIVKKMNDSDIEDDFDTLINKTNKKDDDLTLSYLLNIIDGLRETPGRIIIITSNNYESLDTALVRPGRIDYTLKMNNASRKIVEEMFFHYYEEPMSAYYDTDLIKDYIVSPAEIVNIKLFSSGPEDFVKKLSSSL